MTFNRFYNLCESPDIVYTNAGVQLGWADKDARTFGWLDIIPNVSPFLLYATQSGSTHYELVYMVLELFQYARRQNTNAIKKAFNRDYKEYFDFYPSFNKVIDLIAQNKLAWESVVAGQVEKNFNKQINKIVDDDSKPVTTEMTERQIAFKHSGRIWLQSKVISFWATEITESIIKGAFKAFNVPEAQMSSFLLDVIDPENVNKEETNEKKLQTVGDYFSGGTKKTQLTKEQEKRIAELMAKRHTETNPAKKKMIQKELEQYGQSVEEPVTTPKRIPLDIRQKMMTSENYNFFDYFKESRELL